MSEITKLAARAQAGDKSVWDQLYQLSGRWVYFTCHKFLQNDDDAKDATQDVFLTAMTKIETLSSPESFGPWINRIAVNRCKNALKTQRSVSLDEKMEEYAYEIPDEEILPDEYIYDKSKNQIIMQIIKDSLSDVQFQTIFMHYYNGMKAADIAEAMECPLGTVTYRLKTARDKIRASICSYETKTQDRLHAAVGVPFLTKLFIEEASHIDIPTFTELMSNTAAASGLGTAAASGAKKAARSAFRLKLTAGAAAVAVAAGTTGYFVLRPEENHFDLLRTEYAKQMTSAGQTCYRDGSKIYFPLSDDLGFMVSSGNGYYCYDTQTKELKTIIPPSYGYDTFKYYDGYTYCLNSFQITKYHVAKFDLEGNMAGDEFSYSIHSQHVETKDRLLFVTEDGGFYVWGQSGESGIRVEPDFRTVTEITPIDEQLLPESEEFSLKLQINESKTNLMQFGNDLYLAPTVSKYAHQESEGADCNPCTGVRYDGSAKKWIQNESELLYAAQVAGKYVLYTSCTHKEAGEPVYSLYDRETGALVSENCGYIQNHFGGDGFFEITEDDALVYISIDRRDPKKEIRTVICEEEKGTRNEYLLIDSEYYILISDEEMYMCRIGSEERVPLSLE